MFNRKRKTSVSITHLCQREVIKTLTTKLKLTRTTEHLLFLHHDFLKKEFQASRLIGRDLMIYNITDVKHSSRLGTIFRPQSQAKVL